MTGAVLVLSIAISVSGVGQAVASSVQTGVQRVLITNKSMPVTGSVSVSGSVPVTGSVSVSGSPTVKIDPSGNIVQSGVGAPSEPVQFGGTKINLNSGGVDNTAVVYTVPAGKRLVIEFVSVEFSNPGTDELFAVSTGSGPPFFIPLTHEPNCVANCALWVASEQTRVYANAGEAVTAHAFGSPVTGTFSFSGYLVNAT
jgi:hypothetical protein